MPRQNSTITTPVNSERSFYNRALAFPSPLLSTLREQVRRDISDYDTRKFGIEIEAFGISRNTVARILEDHGIPCVAERYNHDTRNYWKVVTDGSIHPAGGAAGEGFELVSPPLSREEGIAEVKKVLVILRENGARVNASCGIHVHVDVRNSMNIGLAQILNLRYAKHEKDVELFFAANRRGSRNDFCRSSEHEFPSYERVKENTNVWAERYPCVPVSPNNERIDEVAWLYMLSNLMGNSISPMIEQNNTNLLRLYNNQVTLRADRWSVDYFIRNCLGDRYRKINFASYIQHGTVEFRQLEGTLDELKVAAWIKFCTTFVSESILLARSYSNSGGLYFDTPSRILYFLDIIKDHPFAGMTSTSDVNLMLAKIRRSSRESFSKLKHMIKNKNEFNQDYEFRKKLIARMNDVYPNIKNLAGKGYNGRVTTPDRYRGAIIDIYSKMPKKISFSDDGEIITEDSSDLLDYVENFGSIDSTAAVRSSATRILRTPVLVDPTTIEYMSSEEMAFTLSNIRATITNRTPTEIEFLDYSV